MDNLQHLTGLTRLELHLYFAIWTGLGGYILKRYHVFQGWNPLRFLRQDGYGILRACTMALGFGYFLPDLLLAVGEKQEAMALVREHPVLLNKALHVLGALLGYTGGSLGYDLIRMLYNIPVLGPLLEKAMNKLGERLRHHR